MTFKKNSLGEYVAYCDDFFKYVNEEGRTVQDNWEKRDQMYEAWDECKPDLFYHAWNKAESTPNNRIIEQMDRGLK